MTAIADLIARQQRLASDRGVWESHWQDLADLILPRRAEFTGTRSPGQKRTERQFDGTPMQAARGLAAALDGLIKSKSDKWFGIRAADPDLNDRPDVKRWFEDAEVRMNQEFYNPKARFLHRSAEVDLDLVVFGTGVLFIGEAVGAGRLMFRSYHLKDAYIAENDNGDIDTLFRPFWLTARQAAQRFGEEKLSPNIQAALRSDKDRDNKFAFMHAVLPGDEWKGRHPFASVWMETETEHKIAEAGFEEFPYVVPRWDTSADEIYGRSPAMTALPDVQTLHQQGKTLLRAGHRAVEPPLAIPHDGLVSPARTWPGGITYFKSDLLSRSGNRSPIFPIDTGANLPLGLEMQNQTRQMVEAAFFLNVLNLPVRGPQMTATEILQRREEFMRIIGPTFGRLETDYTGPMVARAFMVMLRAGAFSEPPEALMDQDVTFEFRSAVSRIGKMVEAAAVQKTMEDLAPLTADGDLTILDHFDKDRIARDVAEANGLPLRWMRDEREVQGMRQQRAEAIEAEKQAEDAERTIEGVARVVETAGALEGPA